MIFLSSHLKRAVSCFLCLLVIFFACGIRVLIVAVDERLAEAATEQSTRRVSISNLRGTVYDCNGTALTNSSTREVTVIFPNESGALAAARLLEGEELEAALEKLRKGTPAVTDKTLKEALEGTQRLTVPVRYNGSAVHIIGYRDGSGHGVSGIEKGFDGILYSKGGLSILYTTDSNGRMIEGLGWSVDEDQPCGSVSLTIDGKLQKIAEQAMSEVEAGAAVILDAKSGKLRAVVSAPEFSPNKLSASLDAENSPFINRALCGYNVGSVFKPCVAAAALESGEAEYKYTCTGSITVDGVTFRCNKWAGHGEMTLQTAIAESCNTYFYTLALKLGAEKLYNTANALRFGSSLDLGGGIVAAGGAVPELKKLEYSSAALINMSIGQGDLMITPVAMACLYAAIVNGGEYYMPSIVESYTENGENVSLGATLPTVAMSKKTAELLKEYLKNALKNGTGSSAYVESISAGGKTGTAQTGWKNDGRSILNGWFCGFVEGRCADYVIVILKEDVKSGSADCAPIFREITLEMRALGY